MCFPNFHLHLREIAASSLRTPNLTIVFYLHLREIAASSLRKPGEW
jgi:hypothetical protein